MTKQELLAEASRLAKEHEYKKQIIQGIFDTLDKEPKMSKKHVSGIASVNELLKEMEDLEIQHTKVLEQIRG